MLRLFMYSRSRRLMPLLLWVCIAFVLFYAKAADVLLTFCLGGQIPGTQIIISPGIAMIISFGSIALICGTTLWVLRMRRNQRNRHLERPLVALNKTVPEHISRISDRDAKETAGHTQLNALFPSMHRKLAGNRLLIRSTLLRTMQLPWKALRVVVLSIRNGIIGAGRFVVTGSNHMNHNVQQAVSEFWQWVEPQLWEWDGWLEQRSKSLTAKADTRLSQYESVRIVKTVTRESRAIITEARLPKGTAPASAGTKRTLWQRTVDYLLA